MPDRHFAALLAPYQRRLRMAGVALALLTAASAGGLVLAAAALTGIDPSRAQLIAIGTFLLTASLQALRSRRHWTAARVALTIERRAGSLDNLVVTAEEVANSRGPSVHPAIREDLYAAAGARLSTTRPAAVQPLGAAMTFAAVAVLAMTALMLRLPFAPLAPAIAADRSPDGPADAARPGDLRVTVTAPQYVQRPPTTTVNPTMVTAIEGSRVRLELIHPAGDVMLLGLDGRALPFGASGNGAVLEIAATDSMPLMIRHTAAAGVRTDRLVQLRVQPDQRPVVAIREPAKDLIFPDGTGQFPVRIDARDDVALRSLSLHYTRVSGSGEAFTFEEGEWPIAIEREGAGNWVGRATFSLAGLKVQDGDTVVYRAMARDARPGADPSTSDTYLIEIGRLAGVASTGFALPAERDRQAISQQILIIKTERLHAGRGKLSAEALREQAQLLAIEQRMVKAEFVFMTGGEVQDEVEEATHAHELAEGRLENSGQAELLTAIREMSRAEARLNAAETAPALEFERAALTALQRAFDRRRYLLRTLPERARIDTSRRLTGDLGEARSSTRSPKRDSADAFLQRARRILADVTAPPEREDATMLASRVLALDANAESLQQAALQLSSARDATARADAVRRVQHAIVELMRARVPDHATARIDRKPITGRLVEELPASGRRP